MKKLVLFFIIISFFSCKKVEKKEIKKPLLMYKSSEMAKLMNKMFEENAKLKEYIKRDQKIGAFNSDFLKIHTATLTDPSDRNALFNAFATSFIQNQKEIYLVNKENIKKQFNTMVQNCVSCHENSCTGPIPKIKKLIIK